VSRRTVTSPGDGSRPSLRQLAASVAFDVNRTVGGGHASIELLRRTFTSRGWLDADAHALNIAVSRLTPGTNILAYCVTLGWRYYGWPGALIALVAASVPASVIVFLLTATLARIDRYAMVRGLLALGILVAGVLVLASAWALVQPYLAKAARVRALLVAAIAAGMIGLDATPVRVLLVAALTGFVLPKATTRR
jgi:chromate transporter